MAQDLREALKARVQARESLFQPAWHHQTMRLSFEEICQGERPWTALGNFMNHWYGRNPADRPLLVADPLPEHYAEQYQQWAAFCTASVRWFCATYEIPCPSWIDNPRYVLPEPWYLDHPSSEWARLKENTAEEFTRHNIYCGNVLYTNKYERDGRGFPLKEHPVDLQERRAVVCEAAARLARERARQQKSKERWPRPLQTEIEGESDGFLSLEQG